ncbi:hypothetical protein [Microcystis aeruginosa]|uniref:Uncharacterized protein n=1 Tax=Microcystis aeruginosa 11-30S32 TaxID=2358142 RepID=A0A510PR29_MICAE|nr:hypothetical protein [Microcystis aeruginosa]GCA96332.1 conserved hypothetical protein [Microcystis aeruginosa 11-30S32]
MLNAVEFKAKIKQGIIEIPEEYQQDLREDSEVQVIVIKQTTTRTNSELKNKEIIGSSLPFMLNQQTRCQDNILLTQKFRKFLKP